MAERQSALWQPSRACFTKAEMIVLLRHLSCVFDAVRLVDPISGTQWTLDEQTDEFKKGDYRCWSVWGMTERCAHCISRRVLNLKGRTSKFEFADDDLHHVTAKYVEIDGNPYSLEMVYKVPDETMLEAHGRRDIVETITRHNRRVYTDPLTGAYNRRYMDEMFQGQEEERAVAIIDADNFKRVNDTYGHGVGDQVLKGIVEAVSSCIRSADALVRFGGDEFVVFFDALPQEHFFNKLEQIRLRVMEIEFPDVPAHHQTISIGGVFGQGAIPALVARADKMLYRAKNEGRNCVRLE